MAKLHGLFRSLRRLTGLFEYTDSGGNVHRGKTIWDVAALVIVPLTLAVVAFCFEERRDARDREIAAERAQEAALTAYLDRMSNLLLEHGLRQSNLEQESESRHVARAQTLATLRVLDGSRKGMLVKFLHDTGMISGTVPVIFMVSADLSGARLASADLSRANLFGADLFGADFSRAFLTGARLVAADLTTANLSGANLIAADLGERRYVGEGLSEVGFSRASIRGVDLGGAIMTDATVHGAILASANLVGADLTGAFLIGTNLAGANFTGANLAGADLAGAGLAGADLRLANLERAQNLAQAQLDSTISYFGVRNLPAELSPDPRPTPTPRAR